MPKTVSTVQSSKLAPYENNTNTRNTKKTN